MKKKLRLLLYSAIVPLIIVGVAFAATKFIKADEGGIVELSRGVYLEILADSLEEDTKIHAHMSSCKIEDDDDDESYNRLVFTFGPSGTEFNPEAELHIPLDLLEEDDIDEIAIYNDDGEPVECYADWENDELIVYIPHFSYYYRRRR